MAEYGNSPYGLSPYGGPSSGGGGSGEVTPTLPDLAEGNVPVPAILPLPYKIENFLSDEQQTMSGGEVSSLLVSGWSVGSGCTLSRSTRYQKYDPASLAMFTTSQGTTWIHSGISGNDYLSVTPGVEYRTFAWVRTEASRREIHIGIQWANAMYESDWDDVAEEVYYSVYIIGATEGWSLISFIGIAPNSTEFKATRARVRIEMPDAGSIQPEEALSEIPVEVGVTPYAYQRIWIDDPVFTEHHRIMSGFTRLVYRWIPEYLRLLDGEEDAPYTPMARYIDLVGATANRMLSAAVAFDYIPEEELAPGYQRSTLVNPNFYTIADIAEERWLPWLAFITGTRPYVATALVGGVSTPWYRIEELASPNLDGVDSSWDTLEAWDAPTTWDDLETADPLPQDAVITLRETIRSRGTGIFAGTVEGLKRAARIVLGSTTSFDLPAYIVRKDGYVTATFDRPLPVSVSDQIVCYDSNVGTLDQTHTISSVSSNQHSIQFLTSPIGSNITKPIVAYFTNKEVSVIPNWYTFFGTITGSNGGGVHTITIYTTRKLPSMLTGPFTISGGTAYDGELTPVSFTISEDRQTLVLTMATTVSTAGAGSGTRISSPCDMWCLTIETIESQTPDADLVLAACNPAKAAGCVLSHQYAI